MAILWGSPNVGILLAIVSVVTVAYLVGNVIYNLFLHPLRSFPGPRSWRACRIPYSVSLLSGRLPFDVLDLHRQYGAVVRIAPDELVFADARAWRDIMGHRAAGQPEMEKADRVYQLLKDAPRTLLNARREEHGRVRRQLAHGFSERSMREQQPIIQGYIDLLIRRLHENCAAGTAKLDMVKWYNYTTFDIIGDLAFGESFGCLAQSQYHPWVTMVFQSIKISAWLQVMNSYPLFKPLLLLIVPKDIATKREEHLKLTKEKVLRRIELGAKRPDFLGGLLEKKNELGMGEEKLRLTASLLIIAGSETTATLLSGVSYLLTTHPAMLQKLTREVRMVFQREEDIDFVSVSQLPYMMACLDEALRMYPPTPFGLPRSVPKGGANIAGRYVPEDTTVSLYQYALYHNEEFFKKPEEFHPERWLGDPEFATDDRDVFQPFHIGPRNCIGRNLAYIEMRLILARVLWNFDMTVADDSKDWMAGQSIYFLWEKGPLNVHLTPRAREE